MHQRWYVTTPSHIPRARKDVLNTVLSMKTLVVCRTDGCVLLVIPDALIIAAPISRQLWIILIFLVRPKEVTQVYQVLFPKCSLHVGGTDLVGGLQKAK